MATTSPTEAGARKNAAAVPASPSPTSTSTSVFLQGAVCGGLAAMSASACTHPLDLLKVRLQLSGELDPTRPRASIPDTVRLMLQREGVRGFYRGLSASLLRQALYSPARFGLFQLLMDNRLLSFSSSPSSPPSTGEKLVSALLSGAFGGLLSSPADLVMVRMQADGRLAATAQRKYTGVIGGLRAVASEGGVTALWRGTTPNMQRAMITTCAQFVSYDYFKTLCRQSLHMEEGLKMHLVASMMSGVVVAALACPADVIRTRMMNSKRAAAAAASASASASSAAASSTAAALSSVAASTPSSSSSAPFPSAPVNSAYVYAYRNTGDAFVQTLRKEGLRGLYKGFLPYYSRVAPQVTLMFVYYEQIQKVYVRLVGGTVAK